jgi:methyl-accepting chemotaxis protein
MRISTVAAGFGLALAIGVVAGGAVAGVAINNLRIGGEPYQAVIDSKDFIADILPPPLYLVEANLIATEVAVRPQTLAEAAPELARLKRDYATRAAFWRDHGLDPEIARILHGPAQEAADRFWTAIDQQLLPAARSGDEAALARAVETVDKAFHDQKAAVEAMVPLAAARGARVEAEAQEEVVRDAILIGLMMVLLGALIGAAIWFVRSRILRPVAAMTDYMGLLAGGDYSREVPFAGRDDELGQMAQSVATFRQGVAERRSLREQEEAARRAAEEARASGEAARLAEERARASTLATIGAALSRLSEGDLAARIDQPLPAEYEQLRRDYNLAAERLAATLDDIRQASQRVGHGAREITAAADDLSRRTEHQAASLEESAAALEQITSQVRMASDAADQARRAVSTAGDEARRTGEQMDRAVSAVHAIESASGEIATITSVIDEIAFQTNLLALNAGVEAARAGDAGRGFAVVAQEVRALAQRSAEAARDIKGLIAESSSRVGEGVDLVAAAGRALRDILARTDEAEARVREIAASAREQAGGVQEINVAVGGMDQVTQQNAAMVEQTTAAAHSLSHEAADLIGLVGRFRLPDTAPASRAA